jgi:quinol monooxygenase YgiN
MISSITGGLSCSGARGEEHVVVIVAGHLIVGAEDRDEYLAGCAAVVEQGRSAPGCLDFVISADLLDPRRINVFERWDTQDAVEAFRGSGPSDAQTDMIVSASVSEYDISAEHSIT